MQRRHLTDERRKSILVELTNSPVLNKNLELARNASEIRNAFQHDLYLYFCATQIARSTKRFDDTSRQLVDRLFSFRVRLESAVIESLKEAYLNGATHLLLACTDRPFGFSKKQGLSFRLPLTTCQPSKLCGNLCYAHDGLDASGASVIRGCLNFFLSWIWKNESDSPLLNRQLDISINRTIKFALNESSQSSFERRARIRFAHLGEMAAIFEFANFLAEKIKIVSKGTVDCVVYSRHKEAHRLDPILWIVNFTIDESSIDRIIWAPKTSRIVSSAFNGVIQPTASVNFLEHHRHSHSLPKDAADNICPATLPETNNRSCDGVKCNKCFVRVHEVSFS